MSKTDRQRTARQRLAEERARQDDRRRRQRALFIALGAVVVIAVVLVIVVAVRGGDDAGSKSFQGALAPVSRQADGSVVMAGAGVAKPVLEIFEDFQCPACKGFEEATGKAVKELAGEGKVKVVYRPFSLFKDSPEPTKGNSLRSLNASFCAPADKWMAYHDKLYKEQGPEGSKGFENADLISWARDAGISDGGFEACVNGTQKSAQIDQANAAAAKAGVQSTPWATLDGRKLGQDATFTADGLRKAVSEAARS